MPLRIIHTADWHIGQTLAGHGREAEHRAALAHIVTLLAEWQPDVLILAGDVFDSQMPSGESQRLFYETLVEMARARPGIAIVVTAGNHDGASRLEAPAPLLDALGVRVVGSVHRRDGRILADRHLVPISIAGARAAHVLAVSYPTAMCLGPLGVRGVIDEAAIDDPLAPQASPIVGATARLYADLMAAVRAQTTGYPLIVTGHLHVAGGLESEGAERRILIGGAHALPPAALPPEADYIALGHLHRPHHVGRPHVRYAGSLFPLSASEIGYQHGVTCVAFDDNTRQPRIEHVPIPRPVPFLALPAKGHVLMADLAAHIDRLPIARNRDQPRETWPYLVIRLAREGLAQDYRTEVETLIGDRPVRLVDIRVAARAADAPGASEEAMAMRLGDLRPVDLFARAFEAAHDRAPETAHLNAFHEIAAAE